MTGFECIFVKRYIDETFSIRYINGTQPFNSGDSFILKLNSPLNAVISLTDYADTTQGETKTSYLKKFFKYKNCRDWSELISIDKIKEFKFDIRYPLDLEFYYLRVDDKTSGPTIYLSEIEIKGTYNISEVDVMATILPGQEVLLGSKDIYKVFSLKDFKVMASKYADYDIKYRFTQNNGRTYSEWENLIKETISTIKLDDLRFAQVQYCVKNMSTEPMLIYDIILEGEFENVSANYLKSNRYGLKQDIISYYMEIGKDQLFLNYDTMGLSSYQLNNEILSMTEVNDKSKYWNPYQFEKLTSWISYQVNIISDIWGWAVDYYLSDPDGNGIDHELNEYQLKNITTVKPLKIVIPDNQLPQDGFGIDQMELTLFDSFEVQITKDEFKKTFGIEKRPGQEDVIHFFLMNRVFYVKSVQAYKDVLNAVFYYRVFLEDYKFKPSVRFLDPKAKEKMEELTKNTTMAELFGEEKEQQEAKIANKDQQFSTTLDKIRQTISPKVTTYEDSIYDYDIPFIQNYYDLSDTKIANKGAVNYTKADNRFTKGDNRSFICWFNFKDLYNEDSRISTKTITNYNIQKGTYYLLDNYSTGTTESFYYKLAGNISGSTIYCNGNISSELGGRTFVKDDIFNFYDLNNNFITGISFVTSLYDGTGTTLRMSSDLTAFSGISYFTDASVYAQVNYVHDDYSRGVGYRVYYSNNFINLDINDKTYQMPVSLNTNIWYGLCVNIDQRRKNICIKLYKRNIDYMITMFNKDTYEIVNVPASDTTRVDSYTDQKFFKIHNTELSGITTDQELANSEENEFLLIYENEVLNVEPVEFYHENSLKLIGSNIYYTNLRLFNDVIPESSINNVMHQLIITDTQYLMMADNADRKLYTTNYYNKNFRS